MKHLTALLCFALTMSQAATLHTLTVKVVPPQQDAEIVIGSVSTGKFACPASGSELKIGNTLTCKVSSGKYKVYVFDKYRGFDSTPKIITVTKSMTVEMAVTPTKKAIMVPAARSAFNQLLIKITGTISNCNETFSFSNEICAEVKISPELVKRWVGLVPEMNQTTAWEEFGSTASFANFMIGGQKQKLLMGERSDGSVFLIFSVGNM